MERAWLKRTLELGIQKQRRFSYEMKYQIKDRNNCEILIPQLLSSQKFNDHESEWKFKVTNEPDVAGNNKETEYLWIN